MAPEDNDFVGGREENARGNFSVNGIEIEYLTRSEMMAKLRENMSRYLDTMRWQKSNDKRVLGELNARAASTEDPAMAAMFMTVASELAESMNARLEIEVNTKLAEVLGETKEFDIGDTSVFAVPERHPVPEDDTADNRVITSAEWRYQSGSARREETVVPAAKKYYALKDENGNPVAGDDVYEQLKKELTAQIDSANKKRAGFERTFLDKAQSDIRKYDDLLHKDEDGEIEEDTVTKFSWKVRENLKQISKNYERSGSAEALNIAVLERCSNLRNIGRAMLNGGLIWNKKYGTFDEQEFREDGMELPYGEFRSEDDYRCESTIETMAYVTEKARNAIDLAANGAGESKSYSRLNKAQLGILKTKLEADNEHDALYHKNELEDRFDTINERNKVITEKAADPFTKENAVIGMCIFSDKGENIRVSDFIEKVNNGEELTDEERGWACRQFDLMAEQSGADIRGMYVNGEPVFRTEYYKNPEEYEDTAKCTLIASALEGKRIAAVPVKDGFPVSGSKHIPVAVIDQVEPTLTLWEKILEFFGFGRGSRIREANKNNEEQRSADAEYIDHDIQSRSEQRIKNDLYHQRMMEAKNIMAQQSVSDPVFGKAPEDGSDISENTEKQYDSNALRLKNMAADAVESLTETLVKNEKEFFGDLYPELGSDYSDSKFGFRITDDLSYTNAKGMNSQFIVTMGRLMSRTHFMTLYGMTKGYTLDEMLNGKDVDRGAIAKEFMERFRLKKLGEFAEENNMDAESPEARKSYNEYLGEKKQDFMKLSTEMYEALKKQEFIAPNPNDPESFIKNYAKNRTFFSMVGDYVQAFGSIASNDIDPSDPAINKETEKYKAVNDYEYYKLMPVQAYSTAYDKYMNFLSSDMMLANEDGAGIEMDMAARSKCFFETTFDSMKGKKTWGEIMDDKTMTVRLISSSMCAGEDDGFDYDLMNDLNYKYLHSTDGKLSYIKFDVDHYCYERLGIKNDSADYLSGNIDTIENAYKEAEKYLNEGFDKNLSEAFDKAIEQENKAKEAPVREKMDFSELLGGGSKRVTKSSAHSEKQLETEKSKGAMSTK